MRYMASVAAGVRWQPLASVPVALNVMATAAQDATGKVKEATGKSTDNEQLEAGGEGESRVPAQERRRNCSACDPDGDR